MSSTNNVSYCQNNVNYCYDSYRINPNEHYHHYLADSISSHINSISSVVSNNNTSNHIKSNYLKECAIKYKPFLNKCNDLSDTDIKKMTNKEIKNVYNTNGGDFYNVYNYDSYYNYDYSNYSNYSSYNYDGTRNY